MTTDTDPAALAVWSRPGQMAATLRLQAIRITALEAENAWLRVREKAAYALGVEHAAIVSKVYDTRGDTAKAIRTLKSGKRHRALEGTQP